jgi:excisionase family DNA binding protein
MQPSTEAIRLQSRRNLDRLRAEKVIPLTTKTNPMPAELLTVAETCAALNIGRTKFYSLLNAGELPFRRVRLGEHWRFSRREVERYCHGDLASQLAGGPSDAA